MKSFLQHHFNQMHVYCRLCAFFPKSTAKSVAIFWGGSFVYSLLYTKG